MKAPAMKLMMPFNGIVVNSYSGVVLNQRKEIRLIIVRKLKVRPETVKKFTGNLDLTHEHVL